MRKIISILPDWVKKTLRHLRQIIRVVPFIGNKRFCPVCGKSSRLFLPAGIVPRVDGRCIQCNAVERLRFVWIYFFRKTNLFDGKKKFLNIAPGNIFFSEV